MLSFATKLESVRLQSQTAHDQRPPKDSVNSQLYFCHGYSRLVRVYNELGVLEPEEVKQGNNCCAAQDFSYNKSNDFSIAAQFHVLITAAMST